MPRHPYRSGMDFHVLGPLRVSRDGVELEVRGAKERTLLAHLVAYAGQVVPSAAFIESLWGEEPPRSAAKSLQTYVLRLRNTLEPDRRGKPRLLLTDAGGYLLAISPSDTDAGRFSRLAELAGQALAGVDPRPRSRPAVTPSTSGTERRTPAARTPPSARPRLAGLTSSGCRSSRPGRRRSGARARERGRARARAARRRTPAARAVVGAADACLLPERPAGPGARHVRPGARGPRRRARCRPRARVFASCTPGSSRRTRPCSSLVAASRSRPSCATTAPMVGRDAELQALRDAWQRTLAGAPPLSSFADRPVPVRPGSPPRWPRRSPVTAPPSPRPTTAPHDEPWLLVVERSAPRPDGAMLLRLAGPGSTLADTATVIDLAPLSEPEVRRVVGGYVAARDIDAVTAEVLASGPPGPAGSTMSPPDSPGRRRPSASPPPWVSRARPARA